ncbi:MAG: hypothetical protein E7489_07550 [Ruminococcaceae bacterium]|nr:hypothetical protein [Oscillospiraceae bacterium]
MMARLGDLGTVLTGNTPKTSEEANYISNDICFIKPSDIEENEISEITSSEFYISEYAKEKARILPINSVLVTCIGIIGKVGINKVECAFNQQINAIIPDKNKYLAKYIAYAIQSNKKKMQNIANAPVVPIINKTQFSDIEIKTENIEIQKKVVSKLEKVDELISCRKEQLLKLDELVKARFIELFMGKGYPQKTVDEVSLGKGEYGAQSASVEYDETRPRYVRITDINDDGTLNDDLVASINPADDEQYKLEYGDFMFARMGATVGKTYAFIEGNQIFAGYLIRYRLNQELINPRYLFWYTKLDEYWNWVKLNQSGAAQPGINAKKYGSLQIPLPPIEEQENFAIFVEQTEKTKAEVQKSLDELEILKKSLMQKYFE